MAATRCKHVIEEDWPGHVAVLSRRNCRRRTKHPTGYCATHRPVDDGRQSVREAFTVRRKLDEATYLEE